jgi:hypothetical protein
MQSIQEMEIGLDNPPRMEDDAPEKLTTLKM